MLTTTLYLKYAIKTWYLLSRILLTLLSNGLVIMTCASIRVRPRKGLHVSVKTYIDINGNDAEGVSKADVLGVTITSQLSWNAHLDVIFLR